MENQFENSDCEDWLLDITELNSLREQLNSATIKNQELTDLIMSIQTRYNCEKEKNLNLSTEKSSDLDEIFTLHTMKAEDFSLFDNINNDNQESLLANDAIESETNNDLNKEESKLQLSKDLSQSDSSCERTSQLATGLDQEVSEVICQHCNIVNDQNDLLQKQCSELKWEVQFLQGTQEQLTNKIKAMESDAVSLKAKNNRWKQCVDALINMHQHTSEGCSDISGEATETLIKLLTREHNISVGLTRTLKLVNADKINVEEALNDLRTRYDKMQNKQYKDVALLSKVQTALEQICNDTLHKLEWLEQPKIRAQRNIRSNDVPSKVVINSLSAACQIIKQFKLKVEQQSEQLHNNDQPTQSSDCIPESNELHQTIVEVLEQNIDNVTENVINDASGVLDNMRITTRNSTISVGTTKKENDTSNFPDINRKRKSHLHNSDEPVVKGKVAKKCAKRNNRGDLYPCENCGRNFTTKSNCKHHSKFYCAASGNSSGISF